MNIPKVFHTFCHGIISVYACFSYFLFILLSGFDFIWILLILYSHQEHNVTSKRKSLIDLNITIAYTLATFDLRHRIQYFKFYCKKNNLFLSKKKTRKSINSY